MPAKGPRQRLYRLVWVRKPTDGCGWGRSPGAGQHREGISLAESSGLKVGGNILPGRNRVLLQNTGAVNAGLGSRAVSSRPSLAAPSPLVGYMLPCALLVFSKCNQFLPVVLFLPLYSELPEAWCVFHSTSTPHHLTPGLRGTWCHGAWYL